VEKVNLGFILPVLNEEESIQRSVSRISKFCQGEGIENYKIIFVDDGSTDGTFQEIEKEVMRGGKVGCIRLSRNFGHQPAICAGLDYIDADYVVIMDGDLQDPPEVVGEFLKKLDEGYDVVYGIRRNRKEPLLLKICYRLYYRVLRRVSQFDMPLDAGDFCVMRKFVVDMINDCEEKNRYLRGLRSYVGFRQAGITYERDARYAGSPKYNFKRLWRLAMDGIVGFSDRPLKIASSLGIAFSVVAGIMMVLLVIQRLLAIEIAGYGPKDVPGYASLGVMITFFSGVQLFTIGVMGEYISRIFVESKKRPVYITREVLNLDS